MQNHKPYRWPVTIFVTALVLRISYYLYFLFSPLSGLYRVDQTYYRSWALRLAEGSWMGSEPFEQGPLYAYSLGVVFRLIGPHDPVVLVLQMLAGSLTCALVYWCGRRLFDNSTGILAGLVAAAYGPFLF